MIPRVAITIVTYNSAEHIERCLGHVFASDYPNLQVVLLDNASSDASAAILRRYEDRATVLLNTMNSGFAGGQNRAIKETDSDWVLTLNPDVRLSPDFISELVGAASQHETVGTVCGKLLTMGQDFQISSLGRFDSTGIYFTPNMRHLDRGSGETDRGQYEREEYVFGATGAAVLFRRALIDDVSYKGEFFDERFFAYREDADLAYRAQLLGWKCLYAPRAVAYHVRSVLPSNRASLSADINMHSVKNRFLLRIKNATPALYARYGAAMSWRDCLVIGACLLKEFRSLRAFWLVLRHLPETLKKRRDIMRRRKSKDSDIVSWFSYAPVSFPVPHQLDPGERSG